MTPPTIPMGNKIKICHKFPVLLPIEKGCLHLPH